MHALLEPRALSLAPHPESQCVIWHWDTGSMGGKGSTGSTHEMSLQALMSGRDVAPARAPARRRSTASLAACAVQQRAPGTHTSIRKRKYSKYVHAYTR